MKTLLKSNLHYVKPNDIDFEHAPCSISNRGEENKTETEIGKRGEERHTRHVSN